MEIITDQQSLLPLKAADAIAEILKQYLTTPILILFSGGSALSIIEHTDAELIDDRVTVTVLDERFGVSAEDSNFAQLEATDFLTRAEKRGAASIDPRGIGDEDLLEAADWFESALRAWRTGHPDGVVLVTQGMGQDKHTAGILPRPAEPSRFQELFDDPQRWVIGYEAPGKTEEFSQRVTVTLPFLRRVVTSSIFYVTGQEKKSALEAVLREDNEEPLSAAPARVIQEMNDVLVFTDLKV